MKGRASERIDYPHFSPRQQALSQHWARLERNIALANELRGLIDQAQEVARESWALLQPDQPKNRTDLS